VKYLIPFCIAAATAATAAEPAQMAALVDLKKVFTSAPIIYSLLSLMSIGSLSIFLYSLAGFRTKDILAEGFVMELKECLRTSRFADAEALCSEQKNMFSSIISAGLRARGNGAQLMIDAMKSEGKRTSANLWQRLSLLNDIVLIAPMLGLLGTVIGMFYAFYDVNRSIESIIALFDGLGIAVGTTVVGLIVAILSMVLYTTLKYQLVKTISHVENEALILLPLIEARGVKEFAPEA
jgi:biopolymer transport protein ExbB